MKTKALALRVGLTVLWTALSAAAVARDLVWTGSEGPAWDRESVNWRTPEGGAATFASGDRAFFSDGADSLTVTNAHEAFDIAGIVVSNAADTIVWQPSMRNQSISALSGAFDKYGPGTLKIGSRFDALTNDFTVHEGRLVAADGSNYAGEYYSVVGSLHDRRRVSFLTNAVLDVQANAVFGGLGAYGTARQGDDPAVRFLFDHATVEFNRNDLRHHFGGTEFRDVTFVYRQRVAQLLFSYNQRFTGSTPCVIGNAGPDSAERGVVFNVRCEPDKAQSEVFVDDITGDDGDDVTVAGPLIDIRTGREANGYYGITSMRKTGPGTLCLGGDGIGSTTGILQVAEGTLRVAAGTTAYDGRSGLGRIDPALKRTVSAFGGTAVLRLDAIVGPRHFPRNWELSVSDGARVVLGEDLPYMQFGALSIAAGTLDYSSVGGFGVAGALTVTGDEPVVFPVIPGKEDAAALTIGLSTDDAARDDGVCRLEAFIGDVTCDAAADATVDLAFADLPTDSASGNPYRGRTFRGRLSKSGSGTLRLTAANRHSGGTEVVAGTLEVDGSAPGGIEVHRGGFLGGTGTVDGVALAVGGGLSVRADGPVGAMLRTGTFAAEGEVRLLLAGGYGRRFVYDHRPILVVADRPAALDLSGWRCFIDIGATPMDFAYDPETGVVSITGTVDVPSSDAPASSGALTGYYRVDWSRDTLAATADGTWTVPSAASAQVASGCLSLLTDPEDDPIVFTPHETCDAQPYATFRTAARFQAMGVEEPAEIEDSATGMIVRRRRDGTAVYCGAVAEGWVELQGAEPQLDGKGACSAEVCIGIDERSVPTRVSFTVDGVTLTDAAGRSWFPRCGTGTVEGKVLLTGAGTVGDIEAQRSATDDLFAVRKADGSWERFGPDELPAVIAAHRPYYLTLPEGTGPGTCYVTKLSPAEAPAAGLGIWPSRGQTATLEEADGVWRVTVGRMPDRGLDFVVLPGTRTFINALPAVEASSALTLRGVEGPEKGIFGGELVILNASASTPSAVRIGDNTRLTLRGALGPDPLDLTIEHGGVLDASAVAGGQAVGALEVGCRLGFGSMCGVRLTASGTLRLIEPASVRTLGQVPCDLTGAADAANVMGWEFREDGETVADKRNYAFDQGRVTWRNRRYPQTASAGWTNLPMWGGGYMQNVVYTSDPKILYSYADVCGPFRSDDGGLSWTRLGENLSLGIRRSLMDQVRTLSVDPRDPDSVVAIAGGDGRMLIGGFMVSRNGGKSWRKTGWTAAYGNGAQRMLGTVLARDPAHPDVLVGGEDWYGIFLSRDNGETWTRTGPEGRLFTCIHWDRKTPNRVYACAMGRPPESKYNIPHQDMPREPGLLVSEDGGASWRQIADEAPEEMTQIEGDGRLVGLFAKQHVRVSADGGATWTAFEEGIEIPSDPPTGHGDNLSYAALGSGPDFWLTGNGRGKIYRRNMGETKWTALADPQFSTTDPDHEIYEAGHVARGNARMSALCSLVVDPRDPDHWFTADWFTIWETKDAGRSFVSRNVGISQLCSLTFEADPLDANYLAYGVHDMTVYVSFDGGAKFQSPAHFWTKNYGEAEGASGHVALPSIAYSLSEPGLVFAAGYDVYGGVGIARSTDHGDNWDYPPCIGMPRRKYQVYGVNSISFRAGRPDEVWACVGGEIGEGKAGPYVSTDRGETWTWMGQGMDEGSSFYTIETRNGGPVRCLAFSSDGTGLTRCKESYVIYRWSETEKRWSKCTMPSGFSQTWKFHAMEADPFTPGRFLVGGAQAVAETLDGGVTWRFLPGCQLECPQFAFDAHTPGLLVLACTDAVRVSWDYGKTFSELPGGWAFDSGCTTVNGSLYSGAGIAQVTVDRKRLFISTSSGGVFRRDLVPPRGLVVTF